MDGSAEPMKQPETRFYRTYTDDFVQTKDQDHKVPENYPWAPSRFLSGLVYSLAVLFSSVYLPLVLHVRYKNSRVLRPAKDTGAFIYCNHTQPLGDVFLPALPALPGRIYTVVSPANLAIPGIGRLLPYLGALPIPDSLKGMKQFTAAMERRLEEGRYIAIFPEAHVWEYYTGIRPYTESAFKFPVKFGKPVYCMTVTYQKRRFGKRPAAVVYVDGPFFADAAATARQQAVQLRDRVFACMCDRSRSSNCACIRYKPAQQWEIT